MAAKNGVSSVRVVRWFQKNRRFGWGNLMLR